MNETPKFESAEQAYISGLEDLHVRACVFASNPISYMQNWNDEYRVGKDDVTDIVPAAMDEIDACTNYIKDEQIPLENIGLEKFINAETIFDRSLGLFEFLQEVGFTATEVKTFVEITEDDITALEKLDEGSVRVAFNKIYGKNK